MTAFFLYLVDTKPGASYGLGFVNDIPGTVDT
jgi:hypothetical protein